MTMPYKIYISKQWGGAIEFEPFAGGVEYVSADIIAQKNECVREALEAIWSMEGFEPKTAAEGYLQRAIKQVEATLIKHAEIGYDKT